jgi:hypothetical protein
MIDILAWPDLLLAADRKPPKMLLAFDPGETTGFARFEKGRLTWYEELKTLTVHDAVPVLSPLIKGQCNVVVENYQVYKWRAKQHVGDTLHTPRLIGCIETLCALRGIRPTKQTAQNAKGFVTDEKLKAWGMYVKGKPHTRDAIRHGIFYLLFHKQPT